MMNMILSLITCLAMIFSGTGSLPAVPENESMLTIRNFTFEIGDESIALSPEIRLSAAVGTEETSLHFEVDNGGQTLLPITGKFTADGLQFKLGNGGNSYTISEDILHTLTAVDEDEIKILSILADYFRNYGVLLGKSMSDAEFLARFNEASMNALLGPNGSVSEIGVEIDDEIYPAQEILLELTPKTILEMMDSLISCGIPEVEAMFVSALDLINMAEGAENTSFSAFFNPMDENISIPVEMVMFQQDELAYESVYMEMNDEASGTAIEMDMEAIARGEEISLSMTMELENGASSIVFDITGSISGSMETSVAMDMDVSIYTENEIIYPVEIEDEGEEDLVSTSSMMLYANISGETVDGLDQMTVYAELDSQSAFGYGEDIEYFGQSFEMNMSSEEALEEDGSITETVTISAGMGEEPWLISFDVNHAEIEATDYFAGDTVYAITPEAIEPAEDGEDSELAKALNADIAALGSELETLISDESILEMVGLLSSAAEYGLDETEEYSDEAYDEDYIVESVVVADYEEAARIFKGKIPEFTAPEGYELKEIIVDSYTLDALYEGEGGNFELVVYDTQDYEGLSYSILKDGVMTPAEGLVVELYEYEGMMDSATVYNGNGSIYFYFYDMDAAEAEAVLAGLK